MAVGVIAKIKIKEGKNQDFVDIFSQLAKAVKANEAGNNFYELHQSRTDPQLYIVLEQYADAQAHKAHGDAEHLRQYGGQMAKCLAGKPEIEYMDSVG